jgi:E3 ubiquitin-protein ligase RGLG
MVEDRYRNLDQVKAAIRQAGLESSNLIIGVDYSKSNEYNGMVSYGGKCLHEV